MAHTLQVVAFEVAHKRFAVPVAAVRQIIRVPEVAPVPGASPAVEGLINLRGHIVPVVNVRRCLGYEGGCASRDRRVLIVESGERVLGLLLDSVTEVLKVSVGPASDCQASFAQSLDGCISDVAQLAGGPLFVLDWPRLVDCDRTARASREARAAIEAVP